MTIWFLLLKMKCLNPQRKCRYCISLIKPLFYYGISFYEGRQDVHVELNVDAWGKGSRERPTTCSHKVPPFIWHACQTFTLKYAGKWAKTHSSCTLSLSMHLLPRLRTPVHQLSRQQPPPTSPHSESLTHMLLKIFSFSLLNTIKLIETEILGSAKPTVGTNIPCTKNLQFIKLSTSLTDCLLSCEYNRTLLVPHYTQE